MRAFLVPSLAPRREEVPALPEAEGQGAMSIRDRIDKILDSVIPRPKVTGIGSDGEERTYWIRGCECGDKRCRKITILLVNPFLLPFSDGSGRLAHAASLRADQVQQLVDNLDRACKTKNISIKWPSLAGMGK